MAPLVAKVEHTLRLSSGPHVNDDVDLLASVVELVSRNGRMRIGSVVLRICTRTVESVGASNFLMSPSKAGYHALAEDVLPRVVGRAVV